MTLRERIDRIRDTFDDLQNRAVDAVIGDCLAGDDFVLPIIDGPPGTGKTTVGAVAVAEYLQQRGGEAQVLYMCYTHYAASQAKETLERKLGLPPNKVIKLTHETHVKDWDRGIVGCKSDLSDLSANEIRRLKQCPVLLCTLHGARRALEVRGTHCKIIIDEFSQVDPAMFFSTVNKFRNHNPSGYALLGDPKQLPVVTTQPLLSSNVKNYLDRRKPIPTHGLKLQHRMHENICAAINSLREDLGAYPIESSEKVKSRDLVAMGYEWDRDAAESEFKDILDPSKPFVIVNTNSFGDEYEQRVFRGSIKNVAEARFAAELAKAFYSSFKRKNERLKPAILSPYAAQVREIFGLLPPDLKEQCLTVYRAQGREYPCVIVSFVRKNRERTIGFLDDLILKAQTYVACSRAQGKLVILFSFDTFLGAGHRAFEYLYRTPGAYIVEEVNP